MNRYSQKVAQYGLGLERINELVMLNLVVKEPETLIYNPETDGPIKAGQLDRLDPNDPLTYQSHAQFPPPLPLDKLVLLNEIQQRMSMGLESKEGALRMLGEEFPEEKLNEIRYELMEDAKSDGALKLVQVQVQKEIMDMTGMMPGPDGTAMPIADQTQLPDGDMLGDGVLGPVTNESISDPRTNTNQTEMETEGGIREELVKQAYGANIPMRRAVDKD
jgi:hypothetical protein